MLLRKDINNRTVIVCFHLARCHDLDLKLDPDGSDTT